MDIFVKLNQLTKLTESEKLLVDYIKNNPKDFIYKDINDLCESVYISKPTVYRLCKKIGIKGYNDLKILVSQAQKDSGKSETDYDLPFNKNSTNHEIINSLNLLFHQSIDGTVDLIDEEEFRLVVTELFNANNISVFPSVGNIFMAESFQQNMMEIGVNVDVKTHPHYQYQKAANVKKGDVVLVISYLGKSKEMLEIVQTLKKNKATVVLISATYEEKISKLCDYHLYMCSYEHFRNKIGSFSSRVSLQFLLDALYACYFKRDYDNFMHHRVIEYYKD